MKIDAQDACIRDQINRALHKLNEVASDLLNKSIQCDSYLKIVRPKTKTLSLSFDSGQAKFIMPPFQHNKFPLPEVNTQSKIRSVGLSCDLLENVRFILSDRIAIDVKETNSSSLHVIFGQLKDNGSMSQVIVCKQEWEKMIKHLTDINADVQRIDRNIYVKNLKNGHEYTNTQRPPLSSPKSSSKEIDGQASVDDVVKFIYSFPDPKDGLEQASKIFKGIKLNDRIGQSRKPDSRYHLFPVSSILVKKLNDRRFKFRVN